MPYKTILVPVDDCGNLAARVETASALALADAARLVLIGISGVTRFIYDTVASSPEMPNLDAYLESMRQRAGAALKRAEDLAREAGVWEIEARLVDDEAGRAISAWARYADLVVVGQPDPDEEFSVMEAGFPEYVVMHGGGPVLFIPCRSGPVKPGGRALVAWNGTREARRAVADALPLLRRASQVQVVMFNPESELQDLQDKAQAEALQEYFERHGIIAQILVRHTAGRIGEALLALAQELDPNLLVMGCYGHSRLRELVLGGTSRTLLKSSAIPILTSH